jgi:hypothetical protein
MTEQAAARNAAETLFPELLDRHTREGINVNAKPTSNDCAPRLFADIAEAKTAAIGRGALADAISRLAAADRIYSEIYGSFALCFVPNAFTALAPVEASGFAASETRHTVK